MSKFLLVLPTAILLAVLGVAFAQESNKSKTKDVTTFRVEFEDGTSIGGVIQQKYFHFHSEDQDLNIDFTKIHKLQLGPHLTKKEQVGYFKYFEDLGSDDMPKRDIAQQDLIAMGSRIFGQSTKNMSESQGEVKRRLEIVVRKLKEKYPKGRLRSYEMDHVITENLSAKGEILESQIKLKTAYLGDVVIDLAYVTSITRLNHQRGSVTILGAQGDFQSIGVDLLPGESLVFRASGVLDLYPMQVGQYTCGPDGYPANSGRGFLAGALLVQTDDDKIIRVLGTGPTTVRGPGKIFLAVERNPWNVQSQGSYKVSFSPE